MQTVSQTYLDLFAGQHRVEVRVKIDREDYPEGYWILQDNNLNPILTSSSANIEVAPFPSADLQEGQLFSVTITGGLFATQSFTIGSCVSREIEVRFLLGDAVIPRMAKIQPEVRLVNDDGDVSEWIPKGTFWLDTRELDKETGIMTIRGYDAMLKGEATYIASGVVGDWPKTMTSVASEIAGLMGLTMDSRNNIDSTYMMQLPTDYSMREILGYIAAANAGNWIITDEGKLRLVRVDDTVDSLDLGLSAKTYHIAEPYQEFSKVEIDLSETDYVEAGDDTGRTLEIAIPIVSTTQAQTIAADVLDALDGFVYTPLTADGAILDPAMEIGDAVTVGTTTSVLACQTMRLDSLCASDVSAPGEDELDHEYPYESVGQREIKRKISKIETTFTVAVDGITGRVESLEETSIADVEVQYAKGTSSSTAPTTGWSTSAPAWEDGYYIWQRTVTTFADSTQQDPHIVTSSPTCIQGVEGQDGVGITSIVPEYYLSTSSSTPTGGSWSTTAPTWATGKYIFTRSHIYWDNNTDTTTTPQLDNAINDLGSKYTEVKQTVDGLTITVTNGTTSSTIKLKSGSTEIASQTIQMSGLVSFTDLSTSGSTTINGANITTGTISADRIDTSSLHVQEVYYQDGNNYYGILSGEIVNNTTITHVGPKDVVSQWAQAMYLYGSQIVCITTDDAQARNALMIDTVNRDIHPMVSDKWNLGNTNESFKNAYISKEIYMWDSSARAWSVIYVSGGKLKWEDGSGTSHTIAFV